MLKSSPHIDWMAWIVFFSTAWVVATVYSSASERFGFDVECAKNKAANKSPMPVKTIPSPMTGMDIVCLDFDLPVRREKKNLIPYSDLSSKRAEIPFCWLRNAINSLLDAKLVDDITTVPTPFAWNHSVARHASSCDRIFCPVNVSASNWFGVQISHNGNISFW